MHLGSRIAGGLCFALAMFPTFGGEIADIFAKMPRTNNISSADLLRGPQGPSLTHGISEIGIEREPCFGTCPVYSLIVQSDGSVRYHGVAHVERIGRWEGKIDPYRFHRVADFILQSDYLKMPEHHTSGVTCGDTVLTLIRRNGRYKIFSNYASSGPSKLWALQEIIDGLMAKCEWRKVPETESKKK